MGAHVYFVNKFNWFEASTAVFRLILKIILLFEEFAVDTIFYLGRSQRFHSRTLKCVNIF